MGSYPARQLPILHAFYIFVIPRITEALIFCICYDNVASHKLTVIKHPEEKFMQ